MNLVSKKIYCSTCSKLVRSKLEKEEDLQYVVCCRCGRRICVSSGIVWKYIKDKKEETFREPVLSPLMIAKRKKKKKESE